FSGQYCSLQRLSPSHRHALRELGLQDAERFQYLPDDPAMTTVEFDTLFEERLKSTDPLFYAIVDAAGVVAGRLSLMRMVPQHGVLEIGHIYFGPSIARRRAATESIYLLLAYAFDTLGYRRVEWKCDNANAGSKRAAERFGFRPEGVFHKHLIVKGKNRDTAWFAILDDDWEVMKQCYLVWLKESNFTEDGTQIEPLTRPYCGAR
ncbi:unnamed protein product, partial [Ectocarpus fasciculatus]